MQLNDLPDDILEIVFRKSLVSSSSVKGSFKSSLSLLSICKRWRQLALPVVYKAAFLQYGTGAVRSDNINVNDRLGGAEPGNQVIATNLDLVASAGCALVVRQMAITVHYQASPVPGFQAAIDRMRMLAREWKGVRALELTAYLEVDVSDDNTVNAVCSGHEIEETGDSLADAFPSVRELRLCGTSDNPVSKLMFGRLAGHYAEQLEVLDSRYPIAVPHDRPFKQLRNVAINGGSDHSYQLPRMYPGTIEQLKLTELSARHSWAPFSAGGDQTIRFPKLRHIRAVYCDAHASASGPEWQPGDPEYILQLPALANMTICAVGTICPLLIGAELPPRMDRISIAASSAIYHRIASISLPTTRRLALLIPFHANNGANMFDTVNRIISEARGSGERYLDIIDPVWPMQPEDITCTNLTELLVAAPASVDTMLGLIRRLPNLVHLTVKNLMLDDVQTDISIPTGRVCEPVTPLDTKISRLTFRYSCPLYSPEQAIAVAKYLLLAIPTLTELFPGQTPKQPVLGFIAEYSKWYPHLSRVKLKSRR